MKIKKSQLTFVSHYGEKDQNLADYFFSLQREVSKRLLDDFIPYEIPQIHGTIIGLEAIRHHEKWINKNFANNSGKHCEFNVDRVLDFIRILSSDLAINIQFGGYNPNQPYQFDHSISFQPYEESFSIKGNNVVLKGWPATHNENGYIADLNRLRHQFKSVNILHKYFRDQEADFDNDFFVVLGKISKEHISHPQIADTEEEIRELISEKALFTQISQDTLSLLFYVNPQVPLNTTTQIPITSHQFRKLNKKHIENWLKKNI